MSDSEIVKSRSDFTVTVNADWRFGWNEESLYLFVEVLDPVITQEHEDEPWVLYKGDSISFEFGPALDPVPTLVLHPDDRVVMIGPTETGGVVAAINAPDGADFRRSVYSVDQIGDIVVQSDPPSDGYFVEAAIPWDVLRVSDPLAARSYAMNLVVSDAIPSGERRGESATIQTNNDERVTNNAASRYLWGRLELTGP